MRLEVLKVLVSWYESRWLVFDKATRLFVAQIKSFAPSTNTNDRQGVNEMSEQHWNSSLQRAERTYQPPLLNPFGGK